MDVDLSMDCMPHATKAFWKAQHHPAACLPRRHIFELSIGLLRPFNMQTLPLFVPLCPRWPLTVSIMVCQLETTMTHSATRSPPIPQSIHGPLT